MRRTLDFQLKQLAYRARAGKLEGARLVGGALVVSPLESEVPDAAEALKWELNSFLPNVHITDLLAEVDGWTGFADKFTHLRTGDMVRNRSAILAAVLADATNLGPKRMAEASSNVSERQISWARLFHVRPETYRVSLRRGPPSESEASGDSAVMWTRRSCPLIDDGHYRRCRTPGCKARMAASAGDGLGRLIRSNGSSRRALRPADPLRRWRAVMV